jgi:hypothetical protein
MALHLSASRKNCLLLSVPPTRLSMSKKVRERGHKEKGNSHRGGVRGWADITHEVAEALPPAHDDDEPRASGPSVRLTLWDFGQVSHAGGAWHAAR